MTTKREVDAALDRAGIAGEISKAGGVWYLVGPSFIGCDETCLHAVNLSQLSPEFVVNEARRMLAA